MPLIGSSYRSPLTLDGLNVLAGSALARAESFAGKAPSRVGRLLDAARERLGSEPPVSNYHKGRLDDAAFSVETPNTGGYTLQHYDPRTVPPEFGVGEGSIFHGSRVVGTPVAYGDRPPARQPDLVVDAYRADPSNRYGGGNGVETMPTKLTAAELYSKARDMAAARGLGVPQLSALQLATLALKEGRADFGANGSGDRATNDLVKRFTDAGVPFDNATFLAQATIKQNTAARLGIPFETAWNGTGTNQYGQSGRVYAADAKNQAAAAQRPANHQLLDIIQRGILDGSKYPVPPPQLAAKPAGLFGSAARLFQAQAAPTP